MDSIDIDDLKPSVLKRLLRQALLKEGKSEKAKEKDADADDKEKQDLADLHEEQKGGSKAPKVESDDLPEDLKRAADDEEEEDEEEPKKKGKAPPFKKGKKPFPFKKKD
jgi:hypothetical protein